MNETGPELLGLSINAAKGFRGKTGSLAELLYQAVFFGSTLAWTLAYLTRKDLRRWVALPSYENEWDPWGQRDIDQSYS
jgi:hypothetical protein